MGLFIVDVIVFRGLNYWVDLVTHHSENKSWSMQGPQIHGAENTGESSPILPHEPLHMLAPAWTAGVQNGP